MVLAGLTDWNRLFVVRSWLHFFLCVHYHSFSDICISEGTNTPEEIEDWLFQTNIAISSNLKADDRLDNYLSVTEFPASSWGYNGLSQQARNNKIILFLLRPMCIKMI